MATVQLVAEGIFAYLRPEQTNVVNKASEVIECRAGEVVYSRGTRSDYMYVVLEGQVDLRFPGKPGMSIFIGELGPGAIFGASIMFDHSYMLTSQCVTDCQLLRIDARVLRHAMQEDSEIGYAIQRCISEVYFKRYMDVMHKLVAIQGSLLHHPSGNVSHG